MSYERISAEAIPDALLETVGVMRRASRSMSSIETELSKIMRLSELDPRLHSELEYVRAAGSAVTVSLSLMRMTVKEMLREAARAQPSRRESSGGADNGRTLTTKGNTRLEVARDVIRRRYPLCSEAEVRNKAACLATRINTKTPSKAMDDALVSDVETGRHTTAGFHFRHETNAVANDSEFAPFTYRRKEPID